MNCTFISVCNLGVDSEGLYRMAGFHDDVEAIKICFDKGQSPTFATIIYRLIQKTKNKTKASLHPKYIHTFSLCYNNHKTTSSCLMHGHIKILSFFINI